MTQRSRGLDLIPGRLDEHEAYTNLIEALKIAEASARQLGYMARGIVGHESKATGWLIAANQFGSLRDKCTALAVRKLAS